ARLTTKPLTQWGLKREFNRRVKKVFDQRGIEIPFPHRTVYMGEPKKGSAPPIHVHLKEEKGPQ
ncbi:MAG: mechanosensitive ion channel family protein, partial [Pseudomonadota bacterium]